MADKKKNAWDYIKDGFKSNIARAKERDEDSRSKRGKNIMDKMRERQRKHTPSR